MSTTAPDPGVLPELPAGMYVVEETCTGGVLGNVAVYGPFPLGRAVQRAIDGAVPAEDCLRMYAVPHTDLAPVVASSWQAAGTSPSVSELVGLVNVPAYLDPRQRGLAELRARNEDARWYRLTGTTSAR